ncbi:hypothetical protein GPJ56_007721 [Histomonas meleagridis]|uniref:uncharacterized protein n=1 Tax=Histomonas meleagridis TaxID=135588 RepID=UPI003559E115|nr:hypothetical protein GPJ56_007721 [Histomonas meleagridis]KAH0801547.1 hypothetical protein GO595_005683 [Histomonas meleagridis]
MDLAQSSPIHSEIAEAALKNFHRFFVLQNNGFNGYNPEPNMMANNQFQELPPQIRISGGNKKDQPVQQLQIYGQTLMPPVMGTQMNSLMMQAQSVPFLYHQNQQPQNLINPDTGFN